MNPIAELNLSLILFLLLCTGLVTLSSAGHDFPGRLEGQIRNIIAAFVFMWAAAIVPPQTLLRLAVPIYTFGIALLLAVATVGIIKKGARRWLHVGVDIQPSEIMKIATPLMLAWYFQTRAGALKWKSFLVAAVLLAVPFGLIAKQPDLGTALLVGGSGFYVIFLAGLSWKALGALFAAGCAALPVAWSLWQSDRPEIAVPMGIVAVLALVAVLSPPSTAWLVRDHDEDEEEDGAPSGGAEPAPRAAEPRPGDDRSLGRKLMDRLKEQPAKDAPAKDAPATGTSSKGTSAKS